MGGRSLDAPVAAKTTTVIGSTTKNLYTWNGGKPVRIEVEDYPNGTKTVKLANAAGPSWRSLSPGAGMSVNSGAKTVTFNNVALNGVSPTATTITLNGTLSLP